MRNPAHQTLPDFLEEIESNTLIISSHNWPRSIDWSCSGKVSLITVFDLNLEAAGMYTLHQIAAAIDLFECKDVILVGHFSGNLLDELFEDQIWKENSIDRLAGISKMVEGDGFSISSEKLVQAAVFLQVQYQYLKFFLDQTKWKRPGQKPSLHGMLLGEDEVVYPLDEFETENGKLPINYVFN